MPGWILRLSQGPGILGKIMGHNNVNFMEQKVGSGCAYWNNSAGTKEVAARGGRSQGWPHKPRVGRAIWGSRRNCFLSPEGCDTQRMSVRAGRGPRYKDARKKGQNHRLAICDLDHCPKGSLRQPCCVWEPVMSACCHSLCVFWNQLESILLAISASLAKSGSPPWEQTLSTCKSSASLTEAGLKTFSPRFYISWKNRPSAFFCLCSNLQGVPSIPVLCWVSQE